MSLNVSLVFGLGHDLRDTWPCGRVSVHCGRANLYCELKAVTVPSDTQEAVKHVADAGDDPRRYWPRNAIPGQHGQWSHASRVSSKRRKAAWR